MRDDLLMSVTSSVGLCLDGGKSLKKKKKEPFHFGVYLMIALMDLVMTLASVSSLGPRQSLTPL